MVHKTTLKPLFSFLAFCLFFVGFGFGQSIFTNPITGTNPGASNPYEIGEIVDSNITVSGIGRGPGINMAASTNNRYNATNWNTLDYDATAYFEFTITPNSGYEIDFVNFEYIAQRSLAGPPNIVIRSSLDGYTNNIGSQTLTIDNTEVGNIVNLSTSTYQNITALITFRIYGWGGSDGLGTFSINDFTFNGNVRAVADCAGITTTWDGTNWIPSAPDLTTKAIINGNYTTGANGNIMACSLVVNSGFSLNVSDHTFVEIQNDVDVFENGNITLETNGAFVQNDDTSTFTVSTGGTSIVDKTTRSYNDAELHYVYWSSPIVNANIINVFPSPYLNRRYFFNASLYLDQHTVNTTNGIPDDIDDNGDDWKVASGLMTQGLGYVIATSPPPPVPFPFPYSDAAQFSGEFNNGNIDVTIYRNDSAFNDSNWNLIGNPYPCAISTDDFFALNGYNAMLNPTGTIESVLYLWTHNSPVASTNAGNQLYNFSQDDYAMINLSGGIAATSGGDIPNKYIPSGQGFFVAMSNDAPTSGGVFPVLTNNVRFNNSMRMADGTSNSQFFKSLTSKETSTTNKLWINLNSNNGVFSQILVAYVNGATNDNDGLSYDAKRITSEKLSDLYTTIEGYNQKFAVQGKSENSLDTNETINLGFKTSINVATLYTLSIAQLQGEFLKNNTIYLKDNLLNKTHNLSERNYTFTSEIGEFNDRFVVMFNNQSLSTDELVADTNTLKIIDLDNDRVKFTITNDLRIKTVTVFDLLGRELYTFKGQNNEETYHLLNLKNNIYIAKVELSNGAVITKKAVKK
ncbi:MAG: hypothetical protein B7Z06_04290 [Flavobacteriales bacterium 32-35-8]|nr:MAG: hypothetical protein B7Z06_04290 [Flavobacteriales bacterium 32-35-8]